MKTIIAAFVAVSASVWPVSAAPRLVVSTLSLVPESQIDLVLDRPAVPPGELGKTTANTWLEITPPLSGKLLWKAQNIATFVPDEGPALGTTYSFAIPAGLSHLDKTAIPEGRFATLASDGFQIHSASIIGRYEENYTHSTSRWLLVFNDDVDPAAAAPFVTFVSSSGQQVAARLERPVRSQTGAVIRPWSGRFRPTAEDLSTAEAQAAPVPNALIAAPLSPLPPGPGWRLSTLRGLPSAAGTAALANDQAYEIGTIEPFRAVSAEALSTPDEPRKIVISFNYPLPATLPADVLESIRIEPAPENLQVVSSGHQLYITGGFTAPGKWIVSVKPPFISGSGLPLPQASRPEEVEFQVIEPEMVLPSQNEAQLAGGSRVYPIHTVNISKMHLRIKKLTPAELVRAYQGYRHHSGVGHNYENISPQAMLPYTLISGTTVVDKEIPLDNPADTSRDVALKWDELLPPELRTGALFVDLEGTPHEDLGMEGRRGAQAIVQLTDIGLAWKLNNDEAFVYAFSCATGEPLKDVAIDLFGEDAAQLRSVRTDGSGLAVVPRSAEARHLRAVLGNDQYITAFDSTMHTVGLWHFPVKYSWNKPQDTVRRVFMFTDRSLYRPGETVRLKGIIRTQAGNLIEPAAAADAPELVLLDPAETEISRVPVTVSEDGSFDISHTLAEGKTGTHTIRLEYPSELEKAEAIEDDWSAAEAMKASAVFTRELRVEEFRRNAFEVEQTLAKPANGAETVNAELSARYYQGQPVAAGKVTHYTRVTPENPYPERFRDFLFGNHRSEDWGYWYHYFGYRSQYDDGEEQDDGPEGPSQAQGEATLSPEGKAVFPLAIPKAEFPTGRSVKITSEVTDSNNQTLTATTGTTVHPAALYVGLSRNDKLARAGSPVSYRIVAIDTEGNPYPAPVTLTATLTRDVNSVTRSRNAEGDTVTRNDVQEEQVSTSLVTLDPAASAGAGQELTVTPVANGRHFLTLRGKDAEGRDFATVVGFHAYGADDYPWLYEDGLRVKLVAEKKSYQAGETARVLVLSPIEGTALVTVEREKVLRSFLMPLKADNPVIEIPVTEDDAPNAYVSVLIVKGAEGSAREIKTPQLRLGYCNLAIENTRDRLSVTLKADGPANETAGGQPACRPGDEVTLTGTALLADGSPAAGAELTLYAEDEGTLAVMGYGTPDPMAFFYDPRILGIEAGVSFDNFLSEDPDYRNFYNKGFFIGGGGDLGALADLYRKNFDPCATWAPAVKADASGKFTHTFKVPDTLTRYRIIAVAHHGASKFGNAEAALVVNKPLMLEPKAPRFANQGDTFSPQVLVQNASPESGTWEITFSTGREGPTTVCKALGETKQTVTLDSGGSATVVFPVAAVDMGTATLSWKAVPISLAGKTLTPALARGLSDAVETTFAVQYPMPLLRQVELVKIDRKQDLLERIDPALLSGEGEIELEFSRSPLSGIGGSVDYLLSYPHGCVEQTTSSLMPWFAVAPLRSIVPAFAKVPEEKVEGAIRKGADRLLSMQRPDGSFSYWPGGTDAVDWAGSYAGLGLLLARDAGANVPDAAISKMADRLIEDLRGIADLKSPDALEIQARALWVLALAERPQPAYQNVLLDRIADLTPRARSFLAMAFHAAGDGAAAKSILTSKVPFRLKDDGWMPWDAEEQMKLLAWATIDPGAKETTVTLDRMMNDRNPYGHWNTTWANGWSLMAVATYAENSHAGSPGKWTAALPGGTVTLDEAHPTASMRMKITPGLTAAVEPQGGAYVRIRVAAKPKIQPMQPVASNGLSVDRIYERILPDGSAEILTEPKVGDLVRVSLRVTLPKDDTKYLVVEDMLPASFETVNTDFRSQGSGTGAATSETDWQVSHSELRTDRAVFYLDHIWRSGTYTLTYLARCTVAGGTFAPPAKVEGMYDPSFFALSASRTFMAE